MQICPDVGEVLGVLVCLLDEREVELLGIGVLADGAEEFDCIRREVTFAFGSVDDDLVFGEVEDGVGEVVAAEDPADDGGGLLVAGVDLPVSQNDAIDLVWKFLNEGLITFSQVCRILSMLLKNTSGGICVVMLN